jgi:hypothetical protein
MVVCKTKEKENDSELHFKEAGCEDWKWMKFTPDCFF